MKFYRCYRTLVAVRAAAPDVKRPDDARLVVVFYHSAGGGGHHRVERRLPAAEREGEIVEVGVAVEEDSGVARRERLRGQSSEAVVGGAQSVQARQIRGARGNGREPVAVDIEQAEVAAAAQGGGEGGEVVVHEVQRLEGGQFADRFRQSH